jgi:hypothetical protein
MAITNFSNQLFVHGLLAKIPVGKQTITVDTTFDYGTKPVGAVILTTDCAYGDYGELVLVHPTAGIVGQLAEKAYIPAGEREIMITNLDGETEVPAGLSYRFTLTAIDANGRDLIVWLLVKK